MEGLSFVILTSNRAEELRQTLEAVLSQKLCPVPQIIVVDNASRDETPEVLKQYPGVEVVHLDQNEGAVARNHGFERTIHDLVVCLDDDVRPKGKDAFSRLLPFMKANPGIGAVTFKVLNQMGDLESYSWCHPRDPFTDSDKIFYSEYLSEGACAIRKRAFQDAGGYWKDLFIGHEGEDLAMRLLDKGYDMAYYPKVAVVHHHSRMGRPSWRNFYYNHRNNLWINCKNLPWPDAIRATLYSSSVMLFFSLRAGQVNAYLRAWRDGVKELPRVLKMRKPLQKQTMRKICFYRSKKPGLWVRLKRHMEHRVF